MKLFHLKIFNNDSFRDKFKGARFNWKDYFLFYFVIINMPKYDCDDQVK